MQRDIHYSQKQAPFIHFNTEFKWTYQYKKKYSQQSHGFTWLYIKIYKFS